MAYPKNMKHHIPSKSHYNELSLNYLDFKSYTHLHLSWIVELIVFAAFALMMVNKKLNHQLMVNEFYIYRILVSIRKVVL